MLRKGAVFITGLFIYPLLTFIPFFGCLFGFLVMLFGSGAVLLTMKEHSSLQKTTV